MIVTSAAVPAVVGRAMMGTDLCLVSATPSSDTTSANSGLLVMIPIAFDVSMLEPPPMARRKSAPDLANASSPSFTFFTVGFCLISLNTSYGMPASSSTSSTFCATPNLMRSLSVQTNALCNPRRRTSPGNSLRAPGPKYDTSFRMNLLVIVV